MMSSITKHSKFEKRRRRRRRCKQYHQKFNNYIMWCLQSNLKTTPKLQQRMKLVKLSNPEQLQDLSEILRQPEANGVDLTPLTVQDTEQYLFRFLQKNSYWYEGVNAALHD